MSKLSWAHPEFGSIIASSSFDRTVKIWEQAYPVRQAEAQPLGVNGSSGSAQAPPSNSRWVERAVLTDSRGTIRSIEFAPHHFGLKLVSCLICGTWRKLTINYPTPPLGNDILGQPTPDLRMSRTALPYDVATLGRTRCPRHPRPCLSSLPLPCTHRRSRHPHPVSRNVGSRYFSITSCTSPPAI